MLDEVRLENRLSSIEGKINQLDDKVHDGFEDVVDQLTKLNGKVAKHEEYINAAKLMAVETKAFAAGRASIHKRDLAILGGALTLINIVFPYVKEFLL